MLWCVIRIQIYGLIEFVSGRILSGHDDRTQDIYLEICSSDTVFEFI